MEFLEVIRRNAQNGRGHCQSCPAYETMGGQFVNPGLFDPTADIMFVTMDPSHDPHWENHDTWAEYNAECTRRFREWSGFEWLQRLLEPLAVSVDEICLADSIKCPVDNSRRRVSDQEITETFSQCRHYLKEEIAEVAPEVIMGFGADSSERVLAECYGIDVSLGPGHTDCGRVFDELDPPVIISPHWFHGWLGRSTDGRKNLDIVRDALHRVYTRRSEQGGVEGQGSTC